MRLRLIALVLLVIAGTAAGFVLMRADSWRDAWLVFGTGLALAAVTGALALTRDRQRQAMPEVERYFTLAPEMVVLAGFDGYWKRVNPTVRRFSGTASARRLGARSWSSSIRTTASAARWRRDACSKVRRFVRLRTECCARTARTNGSSGR